MLKLRMSLLCALAVGTLYISAVVWAYPACTKTFLETYKIKKSSNLAKASCAICHPAKNKTRKLNPYGIDLQKAMRAEKTKKLTKKALAKVEKLDSDKDKVRNIDEIKAGTLPGDPKSKPKK